MDDFIKKSRRGQPPKPRSERRTHCVSVRLSIAELADLDERRGPYTRGRWMRMAALSQVPPTIPVVNREAWLELSRAAANLNQLARHLNEGAQSDTERIMSELREFRAALLGIRFDDGDDGESESI